ncbi:MAG TPA: type IV secretion system protein [Sphingomicrobium sp.]|nr:type IV secretion system protein [Sphingomicrobium sp.]
MIDACSVGHQGGGFIGSMTGYIDCQAQSLGTGAWTALSAPGSSLMMVLSAFLTIFIALIGYNLLLGSSFTLRGATLAFVKIGAVFALATSWPAYETIVYDLVTDGPGQLVSEIGTRVPVAGSDGTLVERLDLADGALVRLAILGPGNAPANAYRDVPPPPFIGFDSFALGGSRVLFLISSIAALSIVRVIAGLLLGLGPFFIAFLLFDNTRSLFEGWVRVLAGTGLAAVAAAIVLGLELGVVEPWVGNVLARRGAGEALPSMPTELFVITCLFSLMLACSLYACFRLSAAFRLANFMRMERGGTGTQHDRPSPLRISSTRSTEAQIERSRASAIASVFSTASAREASPSMILISSTSSQYRAPGARTGAQPGERVVVPLGRSFSRKPGVRVSALATRRDGAQ